MLTVKDPLAISAPSLSLDIENLWKIPNDWKVPSNKVEIKINKDRTKKIPEIRQIYFNRKTGHTTIVWSDGSDATVVRCGDGETFEDYMGFCAAIAKKLFGSTSAAKKVMETKDAEKAKEKKEAIRQKNAEKARKVEENNRAKKELANQKLVDKCIEQLAKSLGNCFDLFSQEDDGK